MKKALHDGLYFVRELSSQFDNSTSHSTNVATSFQHELRYQHAPTRSRYLHILQHRIQHHTPSIMRMMRTLLPPGILSIMLPVKFVFAKHIPVHARQAAPTSIPAVLILEKNSGCCLLSSALSVCTSLTPGFTALAPSQQAPCLCYSSTDWQPSIFDDAVKTCADYASTAVRLQIPVKFQRRVLAQPKEFTDFIHDQLPEIYQPMASLENFCMNVGNAYFGPASAAATAATTTSLPSNTACNLVNSFIEVCNFLTPGFATLPATSQASCLCYAQISTWAPTIFDNAVGTCKEFAKAAETSIYPIVQSLNGFCAGVGNVMTKGPVTTTTMAPITTVPVSVCSRCLRKRTAQLTFEQPLQSSPAAGSGVSETSSKLTASSLPFHSQFNSIQFKANSCQISLDITITIDGKATNTAMVSKNNARLKGASEGEVVGVSFVCALLLLFLC